ncbi:hypothetical protein GA0115234_107687 [Streptomyces sp. DvalAA-43]|jgi:hypothetical protein|nr:hypothetical protein GA0115234_107687 [Streptomyces sp. DvalAA-43]
MDAQEIQEQLRRELEEQERVTRELAQAMEEAARRDGGV